MHCRHRALFMALCRAHSRRATRSTHSVNLVIFVTVELSLCVHVACQTSRRSCGPAFRQKCAPVRRRPVHQVLTPAPCGSMFAYRLRSKRRTARSRFGLSVFGGPRRSNPFQSDRRRLRLGRAVQFRVRPCVLQNPLHDAAASLASFALWRDCGRCVPACSWV